jgi:hypothetical protein
MALGILILMGFQPRLLEARDRTNREVAPSV